MSRTRLTFDTAYLLYFRKLLTEGGLLEGRPALNVMMDSSPQFGRDWLIIEYTFLKQADMGRFMEAFCDLCCYAASHDGICENLDIADDEAVDTGWGCDVCSLQFACDAFFWLQLGCDVVVCLVVVIDCHCCFS